MFRTILTRTSRTTTMYQQNHRRLPMSTSTTSKFRDYSQPSERQRRFKSSTSNPTTRPLPTWKTPVIESYGDYRQEADLERFIGGPLYEHQATLPRLPVPTIDETLKTFLPTALPLAESAAEKEKLLEAVEKFPQQAKHLQERLLKRAHEEFHDSSYLQLWWNTAGYLDIRDPTVVNVSYFLHYSDDPAAPTNIQRGAAMLTAVANFRQEVCSGSMPAETVGKGPRQTILDSTPYKYLFHACRIPRKERDSVLIYDPSPLTHVVVARNGHFFAMDFIDSESGNALPLATLEQSLQDVIDAADMAGPPLLDIGYLSSQNRDDWADSYHQVLSSTQAGKDALQLLQQGAILLCLDDVSPKSRQECGLLFWHGGPHCGSNRWFDKSIQLFCTNNGKAGLLGEHALMDGMTGVRLSDVITKTTYQSIVDEEQQQQKQPTTRTPPRNIFQNVLPELASELKPHVDKAKSHFELLTGNHELQVQSFQRYGSNYMKQSGFSPDAYTQIAMQLATYRLWDGKCGGTYESAQVRAFLHGRTETARSVSPDSLEFCQAMGLVPYSNMKSPEDATERMKLFRKAVDTHVAYIKKAAKGYGVDRHFFGLAMLVRPDDEVVPDLFQNELYQRSKTWRVSTSHLPHPKFDNWGYGEVVPNGVGLAYGIQAECCVFNVTALKEHGWVEPLCHLLEQALLEIQCMVEMNKADNKNDGAPKSRL